MSVRIVFTASKFPLAKLIRWATKGRVSHAMILYDNPMWGGDWVAEATVGGVKMLPAEKVMHNAVAVFKCKFDTWPALQAIRQHVGDGYDYAGLLYFGWAILVWRLFRRKIRRPLRKSSEEFCSEFVAMFLAAAEKLNKVPLLEGLWENPERNDPETLMKVLEKYPAQFERCTI